MNTAVHRAMRVAWHKLSTDSYVDGPGGPRTVLWLTGCPIRCPGCQNTALWQRTAATHLDWPHTLARQLLDQAGDQPLTVTGGEPMFQPEALWALLASIRAQDSHPHRHIIVYTGYVWRDILTMAEVIPAIRSVLHLVDVLVDGPYLASLDDDALQWRGSRNQHPIDIPASIQAGALTGADPVVLDWDTPTITLRPGGTLGAAAVMRAVCDGADPDAAEPGSTRICGQATP